MISDSTTAAAPHNVVSQCVVQKKLCERSSCCWKRIRNIHEHHINLYESAMIDRRTVGCWAKRVMASETGKTEFHAMPHWGCLVTAASPEILQHADTIICDDWWITTWQLAFHLSVSKGSVSRTILRSWIFEGVNEMGFSEPHSWTKNPENLFIWSHWHVLNLAYYNRWNVDPSFGLGSDTQSMEWHHPHSPRAKKLKKSPSPGEVMITLFWHCEGVILVNAMLQWETVNSNAYIRTLTELRNCFTWIQRH